LPFYQRAYARAEVKDSHTARRRFLRMNPGTALGLTQAGYPPNRQHQRNARHHFVASRHSATYF
jgi:hypothetical protein